MEISCWLKVHRRNLLNQKPAELLIQIHNKTDCLLLTNRINGVMVSVLASSEVLYGLEPWPGLIKDYKLVFIAFQLSMQH